MSFSANGKPYFYVKIGPVQIDAIFVENIKPIGLLFKKKLDQSKKLAFLLKR